MCVCVYVCTPTRNKAAANSYNPCPSRNELSVNFLKACIHHIHKQPDTLVSTKVHSTLTNISSPMSFILVLWLANQEEGPWLRSIYANTCEHTYNANPSSSRAQTRSWSCFFRGSPGVGVWKGWNFLRMCNLGCLAKPTWHFLLFPSPFLSKSVAES